MRWLRLYDDTINDPKILKLPDATRWHWIALLCVASKNDGALPPLDDIAIQLRVTPAKATEILSALVKGGLIDKLETGFAPHNWNGRQYKSDVSTDRVKRFRNGQRNVSVTPDETEVKRPQIQRQNTDTETDKISRAVALDDGWPADYGDQFWRLYPRRTEKLAAMKKLAALRKSGAVTWADLIAGVKRYADEKADTEQQFIKQPTVWLNKGCWTDEPANGGNYGNRTANPRQTGHDAILAAAHRKARALDRDGEMAGATNAPGSADGDGVDRGGPSFGAEPANRIDGDYHRIKPDRERVREGEIIPPDQNAAWFSNGGRLIS